MKAGRTAARRPWRALVALVAVALWACASGTRAAVADDDGTAGNMERQLFPKGYSVLSSDRLMHEDRAGWKQVEIEMSLSRDGYHWSRPSVRRPVLPLGDAESWDPDYSDPTHSGPLRVGDELWFYYRGSRHRSRDGMDTGFLYWRMDLGLATLRRDGFASLNAGDNPGTLITRPLTFSGRRIFVNADVAEKGWIKAAVLTRDGEPMPGYALEDALPLEADALSAPLTWRSAQDIARPEGGHIRVKFELKNAKLYAFWIE